jgi:predicted ATPase
VIGVEGAFSPQPTTILLAGFGIAAPRPEIARMTHALERIEVHLPFDVLPTWAATSAGRETPVRTTRLLQPASRLERFGANLANAYASLRNDFGDQHWRETMDYVRLGLGDHVENVNTLVDPGGAKIALQLKYRHLEKQLPVWVLSDGVLAYLAFVALLRLGAPRSLLAFDEPELHLHPALLMRVLGMFETMAAATSVLLATHSDRLLDGLEEPEDAAVLCEIDAPPRTSVLRRPDPAALAAFLKSYRGLGDVRAAGHERSVMTRKDEPAG